MSIAKAKPFETHKKHNFARHDHETVKKLVYDLFAFADQAANKGHPLSKELVEKYVHPNFQYTFNGNLHVKSSVEMFHMFETVRHAFSKVVHKIVEDPVIDGERAAVQVAITFHLKTGGKETLHAIYLFEFAEGRVRTQDEVMNLHDFPEVAACLKVK